MSKSETRQLAQATEDAHGAELVVPFRDNGQDVMEKVNFDNGRGVSIIRHCGSYGYSAGLFELAVLRGGELDYSTPITGDVLGWLTAQEVLETMKAVRDLPDVTPSAWEVRA